MTPIEEAERAVFNSPVYPKSIMTRWQAKATAETAIRAFLEAAAEDVQTVRSADIAFWQAIDGREPPVFRHGAPAKAAILALKEAVNAG